MSENNDLYVEWTGSYPCLCSGEWIIKYKDVELNVPENLKHREMGTLIEYSTWQFDENWMEEWESHTDGLDKDTWIKRNEEWITKMFEEKDIKVTEELLSELYDKIQEEDWRHGSCGGCI
jgi:hypothetical protein